MASDDPAVSTTHSSIETVSPIPDNQPTIEPEHFTVRNERTFVHYFDSSNDATGTLQHVLKIGHDNVDEATVDVTDWGFRCSLYHNLGVAWQNRKMLLALCNAQRAHVLALGYEVTYFTTLQEITSQRTGTKMCSIVSLWLCYGNVPVLQRLVFHGVKIVPHGLK